MNSGIRVTESLLLLFVSINVNPERLFSISPKPQMQELRMKIKNRKIAS
jgi:hypothetical protein